MTTFILDTLAYADTPKAGGFSPQQAETQSRALAEILDRQMATKAEITEHENHLRRDIRKAELRLDARIREMKLELEAKLSETNARIAETKADLIRHHVPIGQIFVEAGQHPGLIFQVAQRHGGLDLRVRSRLASRSMEAACSVCAIQHPSFAERPRNHVVQRPAPTLRLGAGVQQKILGHRHIAERLTQPRRLPYPAAAQAEGPALAEAG